MERSEKKNINGKAHRVQGAGSVDVLPSGKHRVRVTVKGRRVADVFATAEEDEALRQCPADTASWRLAVAVLDGGPLRARRAVELAGLVLDGIDADDRAAGGGAAG